MLAHDYSSDRIPNRVKERFYESVLATRYLFDCCCHHHINANELWLCMIMLVIILE
jgi:hypothetical protein